MLRGWIACFSDRTPEAVEHLEQAVRLLPQSVAARAMLVVAYGHIGEFGEANQTLREMDELSPQSSQDYLFEGYAWQMIDPKKGLPLLEEAVRRRPSALARMFRAEALFNWASETGSVADAERAVQEAEVARQLVPTRTIRCPQSWSCWLALRRPRHTPPLVIRKNAHKVLSEARADAQTLKQMPHSPGAVLCRWLFLALVGEQESMGEELSTRPLERPAEAEIVFYLRGISIVNAARGVRRWPSWTRTAGPRNRGHAAVPAGRVTGRQAARHRGLQGHGQEGLVRLGVGVRPECLVAARSGRRPGCRRRRLPTKNESISRCRDRRGSSGSCWTTGRGRHRTRLCWTPLVGRGVVVVRIISWASKLGHGERAAACQEFRAAVDAAPSLSGRGT